MTRNRLFEGLTCDEHEFGSLFSPNTVLDFFFFALFEDATVEMSYLMGCLLCGVCNISFVNENDRVPTLLDRDFKLALLAQLDVHVVRRSVVLNRSNMALPVSTNYLHSCPILLKYGDLVTGQFLVSGLDHFLVGS